MSAKLTKAGAKIIASLEEAKLIASCAHERAKTKVGPIGGFVKDCPDCGGRFHIFPERTLGRAALKERA